MKGLRMEYKESRNVKITPKECPLGKSCCYESLGDYERKCPYNDGFYLDTSESRCKFDEAPEEEKKIVYQIYAKMKEK